MRARARWKQARRTEVWHSAPRRLCFRILNLILEPVVSTRSIASRFAVAIDPFARSASLAEHRPENLLRMLGGGAAGAAAIDQTLPGL